MHHIHIKLKTDPKKTALGEKGSSGGEDREGF